MIWAPCQASGAPGYLAADKMSDVYTAVAALSPGLLGAVPKVPAYADGIFQRSLK